MTALPFYVPVAFILTTLTAVVIFLWWLKEAGFHRPPIKALAILIPLWIVIQGILAIGGFYQNSGVMPPRLQLFGVLPTLLLISFYFVYFRSEFIERVSLRSLTMIHIVRIPVEIVLYLLFIGGWVPQIMTFSGLNFDILSGISAVIVLLAAFRGGVTKRWILAAFNIAGLILLINIVSIAILSLPTPYQKLAFDQPNWAVLLFPYIWLPTVIVPIVLFSHLAALWKLGRRQAE